MIPYHYIYRLILAVALVGVSAGGFAIPAVRADSTIVSQTVTPGLLTLSTQPSATLPPVSVDIFHDQTTHGSLGAMEVTDSRGSNAGWSLTATSSSLANIGQPTRVSGSAGNIEVGGAYTGGTAAHYQITIVQGGPRGVAQFSVDGSEEQGATPTSTDNVSIGTSGLSVHFDPGVYSTGDSWEVGTTIIPADHIAITPSNVIAVIGSSTGLQAGVAHQFHDTTDSATIMTAASGYGSGQYTNAPDLDVVVPANTRNGTYVGTITETLD